MHLLDTDTLTHAGCHAFAAGVQREHPCNSYRESMPKRPNTATSPRHQLNLALKLLPHPSREGNGSMRIGILQSPA